MRLLIIRHADPYYPTDSLTEHGFLEAELLGERLKDENIKAFYVSPLGRAKRTCEATLKHYPGMEAIVCPWLHEFNHQIKTTSYPDKLHITWDWYPSIWTEDESYYDKNLWCESDAMKEGNIKEKYQAVCDGVDEVLEKHGYKRKGNYYEVLHSNTDTIAFFCHFGVEAYILAHFLGISPIAFANGINCTPSSVTTLITEERLKGKAQFRINAIGDTSHLFKAGLKPSFAGRFCEVFDSEDRH